MKKVYTLVCQYRYDLEIDEKIVEILGRVSDNSGTLLQTGLQNLDFDYVSRELAESAGKKVLEKLSKRVEVEIQVWEAPEGMTFND